jgi:excisionase family DNA binding protein
METDQLKLYSLSQAAKAMSIGRDSLRDLIAEGKIGYITVGNSKKIPYQELLRFQMENTIHKVEPKDEKIFSEQDFNKFLYKPGKQKTGSMNGKEILEKIMKKG